MKSIKIILLLLSMAMVSALAFSAGGEKGTETSAECQENIERSNAVDPYVLKTTDNQRLVAFETPREVPPRPDNPEALPEDDAGHWWDIEFAGYKTVKEKQPEPRTKCGAYGAFVILLQAGHHPYWTSYINGFNKVAEVWGLETKIYNANWALDQQAQQVDQAINDDPDLIILAPCDQLGSVPMLRKIWQAGIPCVTSNVAPSEEGMKYCVAYVGPEDWQQFRKSARYMADKLGKKGGYAVVQSIPGISCYYSRWLGVTTELSTYAPEMKLLAADTSNCETEPTFQLVSTWLAKYGDELKGVVLPDSGPTLSGTLEAAQRAGRFDLVVMTGGHCKLSQDAVTSGDFPNLTLTYQSGETDGADALQIGLDYLNGKKLERQVYAIEQGFITAENVGNYYPAQH